MSEQQLPGPFAGSPPANYERFFVPAIGAPLARDLVRHAALRSGERVLDVACGTGVVARLAAREVGDEGSVAGLDPNPGMLAVARSVTSDEHEIEWHEASAESMPLPEGSFDVVLCQMGLQFMHDKPAALSEMRRVLAPGGRMALTVPGPTPRVFGIMRDALGRHVGEEAAGFVDTVFSLHESDEIQRLVVGAGFDNVDVAVETRELRLSAPDAFLWEYVASTPLAGAVAAAGDENRTALAREVVPQWTELAADNGLPLKVQVALATATT